MNKRQAQRYTHLCQSLAMLGFSQDETDRLLRIEKTLQRWHELECGNSDDYKSYCVERDPLTEKPFMVYHFNDGRMRKYATADRERGALKRLASILEGKGVTHYQQGDPRGCALYLLRPNDVPAGESVHGYYSRGIALCID